MNRIYAKLLAAAALAICAIAPASAQTPVTVSAWGTPVTIVGGGRPNGPAMLDQNGQIPVVNLGNALNSYLPLTGGKVQNLTVSTSFTAPSATYAQATASTCTVGQIYYISDGQKFWSGQAFTSGSSSVYPATGNHQGGGFYGCAPGQSGALTLLPLLMNYSGGSVQ